MPQFCRVRGAKRTSREHHKMVVHDRGCVKTQKTEKRRELIFFKRVMLNARTNLCASECDFEGRSFYRHCACSRFYTAKTHSAPLLRDFSATPKRSMGNVELSRLINARSVTRSPRRRWRAQALIDAVLVTMHAGNKPARLEAFAHAIKSLTR